MERIRIGRIAAGQVFDKSLFLPGGQKLIGPGVEIRESHLKAIYRCGEAELILADSMEDLVAGGVLSSGRSRNLRAGTVAPRALLSPNGQTVVEAGQMIEEHHVEALRQAESLYESDDASGRGSTRRELVLLADELAEDLLSRVASMQLRVPATTTTWLEPKDPAQAPTLEQWTEMRRTGVAKVRNEYARIEAGLDGRRDVLDPLVDELMQRLSHHPTRFPQIALLCERNGDHLADHAYTVAALAMAIATNLQWAPEHVRQVGLAGMLYDLGMLLVAERIRVGGCRLTDEDRNRVQRHPMYSLSMLRLVSDVPETVRLAALQHHERINGTGYPFNKRRDEISDYAKVLAVADAYAAITEPRYYRKPKLPYAAMEETLRSAAASVFWPPAVRALVKSVGLFPVGSYVKLSDGRAARVLACHPEQVDRPLVKALTDDGTEGPSIDLAQLQKQALAVVRPMPAPNADAA
jgi:HD-GYP domain-containing protein (c-di-GMP phosphodiesterase class II)